MLIHHCINGAEFIKTNVTSNSCMEFLIRRLEQEIIFGKYNAYFDSAKMYHPPTENQPNRLNGYSPVPVYPAYPVYGEVPIDVVCPYCQTRVFTVTTKEDGNLTYAAASLLCFMG